MSTHHLRTRLLAAMVAIALGVLVLTAAVTAGLARRTAIREAQHDVQQHARVLATELETLLGTVRGALSANTTVSARLRDLLQTTLTVANGGVVGIDSDGYVREVLGRIFGTQGTLKLPSGVDRSDLDTAALLAGRSQTARVGDDVFTAIPLDVTVAGFKPVLVVSQHVEHRPFGESSGVVLLAAAVSLAAAVLAAAFLARRMTRPLAAMQATTGRIAGGDLSARVDTTTVPDDELGGLARAINGMAEELEASRRHERTFLLSVSHDLRTPLTSIRGYSEAIADGTIDDPDQRVHAAEVIGAESRRLERLVADLLDLARLDAHEFSLTPLPVDARVVIGEAVDAFRPAATDLAVDLVMEAPRPIAIDADPERLKQIVADLVENALKYAQHRVVVGVDAHDGRLTVRVDDDGPGIAVTDLPHVFERLYTARAVPGRKVGTGIGLAIVRELATAMGGSADVERLDGVGTRSVVRLPTS